MTEVKIYKPELIEEKGSSLPEDLKSYNPKLFTELKNGKGLIKVKLDEEIVIQRISHDLYANWESGIRELINNEVRAINITRNEYNKNAHLEIILDVINKKLIIHGIDSLGIDSETFLQVLRYLGRSDNFDSSEVGQFGFGFASYTTLSDTVILETYSLLTKEKFSVVGKSGIGFDILPKPDLKTTGTKITIVYEKLKTEDIKLFNAIKDLCKYKKIPIFLSLPHSIRTTINNNQENTETTKVIKESGRYLISGKPLKEILKEDMLNSVASYNHNEFKKGFDTNFISIERETEDFEFVGLISRQYSQYRRSSFSGGQILLVRTPIESRHDIKLSPYKDFIVNIKNERDYQPTPDRERLKENCIERLTEQLKRVCVDNLADFFDFENWKELVNNKYSWDFYRQLLKSEYLKRLIPHEKQNMITMLLTPFKVFNREDTRPTHTTLEDIIKYSSGYRNKVFYSSTNFEAEIRYILEHHSPCCVVLTKNFGIMEKLGFKDIKTVNGLGESLGKTKISVHTSHIKATGWTQFESISRTTETTTLDMLLSDCKYNSIIIMKKGISTFLSILSENIATYKVVQLKKKQYDWILTEYENLKKEHLKDYGKPFSAVYTCGIFTLEQFFKMVEKKKYKTSSVIKDLKTAKQISEQPLKVYLHNTHIKETVKYFKSKDFLYIPVDNQEHFELTMFLSLKNKYVKDFYKKFSDLFTTSLNDYCYKCGTGNNSVLMNKGYLNIAFYLKTRLGEKHENLYNLFLKFSHGNVDSRNNGLNDLTEFSNTLINYAEIKNIKKKTKQTKILGEK